ncbi:hypothetical protein AK812_SmicGene31189 [Symbiodinium microadriaticum]|uniref:RNase H type-1 domain-containing protein n=1 Tax=Symbiodinium microadriaticum TaxID=2951 RepID=A0A1Q9CXC9_SYMMI|nr:hypothetical protein AK812_SmicGene31189 [Symbiodinium microadriaticum]
MLDSPLVRDGPTVPVNPEELMRIRVGGDQDPPRATADTLFLVYPPDHTPEVLYMPLDVPCSIPEALQAVAECRDPDLGLQFPEIVIPAPQPSSSFAVLIAMPSWAIERIVVMFDCRRVNGSLFPMIVPERLNRESLCAFAKVPSHAGIEVFVRDVPWALAPWQMSELETGDLITISPLGYGPPRRRGLETMLASTEFWDPQVAIPAPPGTFYLLLSDGIPQLFHMPPQHRELLRERIAAALSISEQNMTIRGPRVPIEHAMFRGHFLASVLITTEAVHRLPIPPARLHASQWLLFLDLRRILRGFSWRLLDSCHVDVHRLMREFEHLRPVGYIASITGAPIDALADGPAFRIDSGDTLTVEFIPDYLEEGEESQDEPGDDDPWDPHEDESSDTGSDDDGDPTPPGAQAVQLTPALALSERTVPGPGRRSRAINAQAYVPADTSRHHETHEPAAPAVVDPPRPASRRIVCLEKACPTASPNGAHPALPPIPPIVPMGKPWDYTGAAHLDKPCSIYGMAVPFAPSDFLVFLASAPPLLGTSHVRMNRDVHTLLDSGSFDYLCRQVALSVTTRRVLCYTDGSFYPPKPDRPAAAGWACAFLEPQARALSCVYGSFPDWLIEPHEELSANLAECAALLFAGLIATDRFRQVPIAFLSDCQAALGVASGTCQSAAGGCPQALRHVMEMRRQLASEPCCSDTFEYVPGHRGFFANELVDKLSKHGAIHGPSLGAEETLREWLSQGAPWLPWVTTALVPFFADEQDSVLHLPPADTVPKGGGFHAGLSPAALIAPFVPQGIVNTTEPVKPPAQMRLQLHILSFNTLSLGSAQDKGADAGEGLSSGPGRAALLAAQMRAHGITAAALQETRCGEGSSRVGGFLRYATGSDRGQFGTEWWFLDGEQFVMSNDNARSYRFEAQAFTTVHTDYRRLFIRYSRPGFCILFISLHAPHRATESHILEEWWRTTLGLIYKLRRRDPIVLAGDLNCAVGSLVSEHIGPQGAETEDASGAYAHRALRAAECWAPATFAHCHRGVSETYVQKRNGRKCRVDFVCIPRAWATADVHSKLLPDINAAHATIDHTAVLVACCARLALPGDLTRVKDRRFHAEPIMDPQNRVALQQALRAVPKVPWCVSAHAHVSIVTSHVQKCLEKFQAGPRNRPWHTYLQMPTWEMQRAVSKLRRDFHRLKAQVSLQLRAACFYCWKQARGVFDRDSGDFRMVLQGDRADYISQLAQKIATCPKPEVFQEVHRILQHKRKKPYQAEPLPMIKQLDGTVCEDAAAAMGRWRQHFGGLEAGLECKASDLAIAAANRIPTEWPLPESLQHMPDITDLQRVLSASKPHKATGPDGLPAELGKIFPIEVADILFPLLLKFALRGEEAVGHKSGQAIFFWKGKGSQQECSSYRAILLLSAWAKAVHQTLRPRALHVYHASAPPLQLGSRPGSNVVYGSHLVRAYQRWAASIGNTGFVLFADIASAYYSAVRELVATKPGTDGESIPDEALANLKLSADDLERLKAHAQEPSAFRQAGADPWTEAISHCMTDGTFFMLRGDTVAMATNRGTRPGSSWADILFATVMQRVLQRRNELRQGLLYPSSAPKVPWDGQRTLTPCSSDAGEIEIDDAEWADDLATMRVCTDPTTAPTAIGLEVGCLVDSFREHGFALSFGSRKTAILASPAGAGSRKLRQRLFGAHAGQGKLEVLLEGEGAAKVPLVSHYKHLGAMQGPKGSLGAEITYRTSQAFAAYSEGRRKVYRYRVIPVGRKALILRTAVIPKLTFGCGSWPPLTAGEYKKFSGCLWRMYRSLLCLRHDQEQDLSFHACLSLVELPSPRDTLRMHRLLYIGQMIRGGPDALWALLRTDSAYTATALEAFRWLHCLVGPPAGLPEPDRDWGPWAELMSKKPGHFKGLVKRAVLLEQHRHTVIAALDGLHRGLSAYGTGNRPTFQLSQCQDVCIPCRKAFGSRVSWSGHAAR